MSCTVKDYQRIGCAQVRLKLQVSATYCLVTIKPKSKQYQHAIVLHQMLKYQIVKKIQSRCGAAGSIQCLCNKQAGAHGILVRSFPNSIPSLSPSHFLFML